ncbi:integrase, catalytic region, zinc finger, CCHC-type containing protein [Tanacetum coccineum]
MSTSNTHQQSLVDADFVTRPLMLERGSYIPWASHFKRYLNRKRENRKWLNKAIDEGPYEFNEFTPSEIEPSRMQKEEDLKGDDLKRYEAEIETMNLILISIPNDIYNYADAYTTAQAMWQRVEHLMRGTIQNKRTLRTTSSGTAVNVQCYNSSEKGHYAQNSPNPIVRDSKYFMEKMLLAKQDEAGVILTDKQNYFLFADASWMEEIEELSANICLMANIQPANFDSDEGPSYDSAFLSEVQSPSTSYVNPLFAKDIQEQKYPKQPKIIKNIVGDDQIDSNIIFDEPNGNVNCGSVEYDNNVQESYALEQLARNVYKEAEKQQIIAKKVQRQNIVFTKQLESYKEKLSVVELKIQTAELQKTQSILKRKMSENKDKYHDIVLDLEARAKKNEDVVLKIRLSVASSVRKPLNIDSPLKNNVFSNTKKSSEFSVKTTQSKSLDTTPVFFKTKIVAVTPLSAKNKVVQIVLWIVDCGCSKHMTGDRSLLKKFVEKFMGTVRFRNDHFVAITGYGDYVQDNITICHVYYVEGLGHNLFSVGQFCYGDLEVAFGSNTCYVHNLEGEDLLIGARESNLYTISIPDMAASLLVYLMSKATLTKSWLWHHRLSHLKFGTINDLTKHDLVDGLLKFNYGKDHLCSACERGKSNKASHPPKVVPKSMNIPSKEYLDNLFGPMYKEYFEKMSSKTSINSTAQQVHNHEDSPSTSSFIVEEHEAPPIVTTSEEQTSPISLNEVDDFNQEDSAYFDGNTVFVPYDAPN